MTNPKSIDDQTFSKKTVCPFCGYKCDLATNMNDGVEGPEDGDVSICLKCGELSEFQSGTEHGLAPLLGADLAEALRDPGIQIMLSAWNEMVKTTGGVPNRE